MDEAAGRQRAFWLLLRSGGMINLSAPPVASIMVDTRAALAALEAGLIEQAEQDVAAAERLLPNTPMGDEVLLRLAQASLELARGDAPLARQRLQLIRAGEQAGTYRRTAHPLRAEVERTAGLIALAEGNREAFTYFTGWALAIAQEHQLPLTVRRIEAIRFRVLGQGAAARL